MMETLHRGGAKSLANAVLLLAIKDCIQIGKWGEHRTKLDEIEVFCENEWLEIICALGEVPADTYRRVLRSHIDEARRKNEERSKNTVRRPL